jgi:hypothetical protein
MKTLLIVLSLAFVSVAEAGPMQCADLAQFTEISANYRDQGITFEKYRDEMLGWSETHPEVVTRNEALQAVELIDFVYLNPQYGAEDLSQYVYDQCMSYRPQSINQENREVETDGDDALQ